MLYTDEWMKAPDWPDFSVERGEPRYAGLSFAVYFHTKTMRPKTPHFSANVVGEYLRDMDDTDLRVIGRHELDHHFRAAHPNGCPGSHEAD